jgi:hypothetical protein
MADRHAALEPLKHVRFRKVIADETHAALGVKLAAIVRDDAGRFLPAMLKRVQTKRRDRGCVGMIEDAEHAAFFAKPVITVAREGQPIDGHIG